MSLDNVKTFLANAKSAVRNFEAVSIGGGEFNAGEMKSVVQALEGVAPAADALKEIFEMLQEHPDFKTGNSKVHFCAHKAQSAFLALTGGQPAPLVAAAAADLVYQPDAKHWPDDLMSFEAYTSIEVGRQHHPEVPAQFWISMPASAIQDPTIIGETVPSKGKKSKP
jgi:hypothetical protein